MGSFKTYIATTGIALVLTAGNAFAADMSDPFLEPLLPVEIGSAWYLRGDIGYKAYADPGASFTRLRSYPVIGGTVEEYSQISLGDALIAGGGFGYKFNQWFRTDVTLDYSAPADFSGRLTCIGGTCGSNYLDASAQISTWTFLANAYFDLGTWSGFTPYVGGGIGTANVALDGYTHNNPPGNPRNHFSSASSQSQWNFAWAVTAGFAYDMTSNLLLDLNYRYVSLGDAHAIDQASREVNIDSIDAHEFRVGFRYLID